VKIIKKIVSVFILCAVCITYIQASNSDLSVVIDYDAELEAHANFLAGHNSDDFMVEVAEQPCSAEEKAIVQACYKGDLSAVKLNYESVNVRKNIVTSPSKHTLLHIACAKRYVEIVRYLLECEGGTGGEELDDGDEVLDDGDEELRDKGDEDFDDEDYEDLHDKLNINARNKYGFTPFHCACMGGSLEIVKLLATYGANIKYDDGDDDGAFSSDTPLHIACRKGFLEIVKFLVDNGACVNAWSVRIGTPIQQACRMGFLNIVNQLLLNDAVRKRVALASETSDSLLNLAILSNNVALVKSLLSWGMKFKSYGMCNHFLAACESSSVEMVKFLLECGASLNVCTPEKQTPLHLACLNNLSLISFLRSKGCYSMNNKDLDGKTPSDLLPCPFSNSFFHNLKDGKQLDSNLIADLDFMKNFIDSEYPKVSRLERAKIPFKDCETDKNPVEFDFIKKIIDLQDPKAFFKTPKLEMDKILLKDLETVKNSEDWLVIIECFLEAIFDPIMPFERKKNKLTKLQNCLCLKLFKKVPFQIVEEVNDALYSMTKDKRYYENNRYNQACSASGKTGNSGQINRFVDLEIFFEFLGAKKVLKKPQTMGKKSSISLLDSLTEVEMKELATSKMLI